MSQNIFNDSEDQYEEDQFDDESIDEMLDEEVESDMDHSDVMREALSRIEKAKLYETLLRHSLFAAGSASPDLIREVEREIRTFVSGRFQELVGMKSPKEEAKPVESQFSDQEIDVLKQLADRMLRKANPSQVMPSAPQLNPAQAPQQQPVQAPKQVHAPQVRPVQAQVMPTPPTHRQSMRKPAEKEPVRRKRSVAKSPVPKENMLVSGQTQHPTIKPLPMPTDAQQHAKFAMEVGKNKTFLSGGADNFDPNLLTGMVQQVIAQSQHKNRNVKED